MKCVQFQKQERKIANASIELKGIKRELERLISLKALQSKRCSPTQRSLRKRLNGAFDSNSLRWRSPEPTYRFNTENMSGLQKDSNIYSSQMGHLFGNRNRASRTAHAEQKFKSDSQFQEEGEDEPILGQLGDLPRKGNLSIKEQQKERNKGGHRKNESDCSLSYRQSEYSKRIRLHPRLNITTKEDFLTEPEKNKSKGSINEIMEEIREQMRNLHSDNSQKNLIFLQLQKMNSNEATRIANIDAKLNTLKAQHQWDLNEKKQSRQMNQLLKASGEIGTKNTEESIRELVEKCETKDAHIKILLTQIKRVVNQDANLKQRLKSAERKIRLKDKFIDKIINYGNISSDPMHQRIQKYNGIQETQFGAFDFKKKSNYASQVPRGNLR